MRSRTLFAAAALFACSAAIAAPLTPQEKSKASPPAPDKSKAAPAAPPVNPAVYMTPGAEHKKLATKVGKWTAAGKFWQTPDGPATESTMTTECSMLMDRFLMDTTTASMGGMSM